MPIRNVVLTERQESLIEVLAPSGRYQNASEVMREGLRLVENREAEDAAKFDALRAAPRIGAGALEPGEFKEFADASALVAHLNTIAAAISGGEGTIEQDGWKAPLVPRLKKTSSAF